MKSRKTYAQSFSTYLALAIIILFIATNTSPAISLQRSGQEAPQIFRAQDKTLTVAKQPHIPVAIVGVKNLENDWLRDLEVEVENQSGKPIYFLSVDVRLTDAPQGGPYSYGMPLSFGNPNLLNHRSRATPSDTALQPGQRVSLKVLEGMWRGLQYQIAENGLSFDITKKILVRVLSVSFGDGTGFMSGVAFPPAR